VDAASAPESRPEGDSGLDFPVVGVGASAGGLAAIKTLLEGLHSQPDMAFVIVMHLSPTHESNAAAILQMSTRMPVAQVTGRMKIERDHVYVIPPTRDLSMVDGSLALVDAERPRGRHIVVDLFFRTLAEVHRERAIGIVLSGTGADGSAGIGRLKEHGGIVMAQLPADAEYDGMPSNAIATGKVDIVLPVAEMPGRLVQLWTNARRIEIPDAEQVSPIVRAPSAPAMAEEALRDITKTCTSAPATTSELQAGDRAAPDRAPPAGQRPPDLIAYRRFLAGAADEPKALLEDLLIGVTQFFRDRSAFEALEREVSAEAARGSAEASRSAPGWPAAPPERRRTRSRCC
jgi:two-component system CheB/CheR fusion protein